MGAYNEGIPKIVSSPNTIHLQQFCSTFLATYCHKLHITKMSGLKLFTTLSSILKSQTTATKYVTNKTEQSTSTNHTNTVTEIKSEFVCVIAYINTGP